MNTFFQDLRYAVRTLAKKPGFAFVAVLTLALGIGANTVVFSFINGVLLNPLPYHKPGEIIALVGQAPKSGYDRLGLTEVEYVRFREQNQAFDQVAAYYPFEATLTGGDEPRRIRGAFVSANLFATAGFKPARGRFFLEEEERPDSQIAILSHSLWARWFGSASDIIDRTVILNGGKLNVVGVLPPGFQLPEDLNETEKTEIWIPIRIRGKELNWGSHLLKSIARLKPDADKAQAQAEVDTLLSRLAQERPDAYPKDVLFSVNVMGLDEFLFGDVRPALLLLMGTVGLVLLIVCANVANLLLSRAAAKEKEIAIRSALGAGRMRLLRQLLTESLLLSVLGGAAGLALANWGFYSLLAVSPDAVLRAADAGLDIRVLLFTIGISVFTAILFGLVPALQLSHPDLNQTLREGGRSLSSGSSRQRLQRFLVVAQMALAVVLITGAGLLLKSFIGLLQIDSGLDANNLLTARLSLPRSSYSDNQRVNAFYDALIKQAKGLPGVSSAAAVNVAPLQGFGGDSVFDIEGRPTAREDPSAYGSIFPHLGYRVVTPGYFDTVGTPLLDGRAFNEFDREDGPLVAVINQTMARRFFPNETAIGKRLRLYWSTEKTGSWFEIVGLVADTKINSLDEEPKQEIFVPASQVEQIGGWIPRTMTLVLRSQTDPISLAGSVRKLVVGLDNSLPAYGVQTMEQIINGTISRPRFNTMLLSIFASIALLLATVGIYGVMSYWVSQRRPEIGIRVALGAERRDIFKLVMGQGSLLILTGITTGLAGSFALTRLISSLLHGVSPTDVTTFAAVPLLLALVALLACYIPARRATRVDPVVALRYE